MTTIVTVREFARLTVDDVGTPSLDRAQIPATAFDWLCHLSSTFTAAGAKLVQLESKRWLRLDNYVGVIESPCGTRLEILPKHVEVDQDLGASRALLRRMICAAMDLPLREAGEASVDRFEVPLSEWVIGRFLSGLDFLVKRGVRFDYQRVDAEERFQRGQLDVVRQMRQPPGRQHIFQIRHDVFAPDRPENRLLRLALDRAACAAQTPANWRLAHELRLMLQEIPASSDVAADFRAWGQGRLMAHYQPLRPWCEMVLYQRLPFSVAGDWRGISMLFPMEKLFERYVAAWLGTALARDALLRSHASSQFLCLHDGGQMFRMQPDLVINQGDSSWVLDTKWKRLDGNKANNYGLSQGDFYQLFAYGQRYLSGRGDLYLIYPLTSKFDRPLPVFDLGAGMSLWVVPFDLDVNCIDPSHVPSLPLATLAAQR